MQKANLEKFAADHRGFIARVAKATGKSAATVSRTWYGQFIKPDPALVAALDAEHQKLAPRAPRRAAKTAA